MSTLSSHPASWHDVIAIEPGKRGGRPVIRGLRITAGDVLGWLASGMDHDEILQDHPDLVEADIRAVLAYAAERDRVTVVAAE